MSNAGLTSFAAGMKTLYKGTGIEAAIYKNNPFMSVLPKFEDFYGDYKKLPIIYSGNTWSGSFSTAQTNRLATGIAGWQLTRVNLHSVAQLAKELIEASENDKGAVLKAGKVEADSSLRSLAHGISCYLFRDGSGKVGKDDSWSSGATISLADAADVINFEVGAKVKSCATATGALRDGSLTVESTSRSAGTVTFTANVDSGIAAFTAGDYLFIEGAAYNNSAYAVPFGLEAWVPSSAPSDTFCTVDRSVSDKLGGSRYDGSSCGTLEEALINGVYAADPSAAIDLIVLNPTAHRNLVKELGSKVTYNRLPVRTVKGAMDVAKFGFKVIEMEGPAGNINVLADPHCPTASSWAGQLDTAGLHSLKKLVRLDEDKLTVYNADAVELRAVTRCQFGIQAPGNWVNITLPS